jgi:esterase/lipase superfamily enzyme
MGYGDRCKGGATMKSGSLASRACALLLGLSLSSLTGASCLAQDAAPKVAPPERSPATADACKTPTAVVSAPGFVIQCGKRIRAGVFLGSFVSPADDSVGDCVARCRADEKCVGFTLHSGESGAKRVCRLLASIEGYADDNAWLAGTRIGRTAAPQVGGSAVSAQVGGSAVPALRKAPTIAPRQESDAPSAVVVPDAQSTSSGGPQSDARVARSRARRGPPPPAAERSAAETNVAAVLPKPSEQANIGAQLTPTADMKGLQPVYFATDRTRISGALQEASFTDEPTMDMTLGYAVVSIPKNHDIGNVERPKFRFLKLGVEPENDADHFRIKQLADLDRATFVDHLKNGPDSILLFVHGYNVSFPDAIFRAAQIAFDANFAGTVLAFSWPSAGSLFKYDKDRESAEFAGPHLAQIFHLVSAEIGKKNVYIVAHSMGNQVLVDALQLAASSKADMAISELVMAAPDVDINVFRSKADQIRSVAKNITLYASSADKALRASGEKSFGTRLGFVSPTGPNIFPGIDTIDVTAVGDDMLGLDHSTFASSRAVLEDLGRLIRSLTHLPPDARTPTLKLMPDKATFKYWSYPD